MIITVGGNIGCGKSTLLRALKQDFIVVPEPLTKWGDWLKLFYENPKKYAMGFQLKILYEFMYLHKYKNEKMIFTERSPQDSFHIFCKMLLTDGILSEIEYDLLKDYMNVLGWSPHIYVYIKTSPEVCHERMKTRGRECENMVDFEYLKKTHNQHEEWVTHAPKHSNIQFIEIDGNQTEEVIKKNVLEQLKLIHL